MKNRKYPDLSKTNVQTIRRNLEKNAATLGLPKTGIAPGVSLMVNHPALAVKGDISED